MFFPDTTLSFDYETIAVVGPATAAAILKLSSEFFSLKQKTLMPLGKFLSTKIRVVRTRIPFTILSKIDGHASQKTFVYILTGYRLDTCISLMSSNKDDDAANEVADEPDLRKTVSS